MERGAYLTLFVDRLESGFFADDIDTFSAWVRRREHRESSEKARPEGRKRRKQLTWQFVSACRNRDSSSTC